MNIWMLNIACQQAQFEVSDPDQWIAWEFVEYLAKYDIS